MTRRPHWLPLSCALALALAWASACGDSSSFTTAAQEAAAGAAGDSASNESGGSHGSGGSKGSGGFGSETATGGAAGSGPQKECSKASDCDNGKACDGVETCDDGKCQAGTPFCAGEEEIGCSITCVEPEEGDEPSCEKAAIDHDDDGHIAVGNTCSADSDEPRDDCDDDHDDVYPDANEICDGRDTDCDGRSDFAEGFPLGGSDNVLWTSSAEEGSNFESAAAWSVKHNRWGVVWGSAKAVYFARLLPNGALDGKPRKLVDDGENHMGDIAFAWADEQLGLTWSTRVGSAQQYQFARFALGSDGNATRIDTVPVPVATLQKPVMVRAPGGGWALLGTDGNAKLYRFSDKGALLSPVVDLGETSWINGLTTMGDQAVAFWLLREFDANDVFLGASSNWASWSGPNMTQVRTKTQVIPPEAVMAGGTARVAGLSDGLFFMMRPRGGNVIVSRYSSTTDSIVCGPVESTSTVYPVSVDGEIYATGNGTSAFYLANKNGPHVAPLPLDCDINSVKVGQSLAPLTPYGNTPSTTLASSPAGHLVVWRGDGVTAPLMARAFGNAFCDVPSP